MTSTIQDLSATPRVVKLTCYVERKEPLDRNANRERRDKTADFDVSLLNSAAIFTFRRNVTSWDEAVELVLPYIRAWEIINDLDFPGAFRVRPMLAEIRQPDGTVIRHNPAKGTASCVGHAVVYVGLDHYPLFPTGIEWSDVLELMRDRYVRYVEDREPIASMGYLCLTVLENWTPSLPTLIGRKASTARSTRGQAAHRYGIDTAKLDRLGELCSNRGESEARKLGGVSLSLTDAEKFWIKDLVKKIIRRFGEVATDPGRQRQLSQITLADLPSL